MQQLNGNKICFPVISRFQGSHSFIYNRVSGLVILDYANIAKTHSYHLLLSIFCLIYLRPSTTSLSLVQLHKEFTIKLGLVVINKGLIRLFSWRWMLWIGIDWEKKRKEGLQLIWPSACTADRRKKIPSTTKLNPMLNLLRRYLGLRINAIDTNGSLSLSSTRSFEFPFCSEYNFYI